MFSFILISFASTFAQTDTPNNTIDVSVYKKIKPLIKENTFIVAYIDIDKIDLDGFIVGSASFINQFSKIFEQKLRELTEQESPEIETDPNTPTTDTPTDPNAPPPPTDKPKTDPNIPPDNTPKNNSDPKTETDIVDTESKNTDEVSNGNGIFNDKFWESMESKDVSDIMRQILGTALGSLRASGIREIYILSTMEIIQQCPALIAVHGKINLSPELKAQFESSGIYLLPEQISGFTIFAVVTPSQNQPPVVTDETDIDADKNPFETNTTPPTPTPAPSTTSPTIPDANSPAELDSNIENKLANEMTDKLQNVVNIFRKLKTKDRNEIKSALHIQRKSPIRVVFAPSGGLKTMANMMAPLAATTIPNATESTKEQINDSLKILNKLQTVSIGFIPEEIRFNFAIEFLTEQEAQDTYVLVKKSFNAAKNSMIEDMKKTNENLPPEQIAKVTKLIDNFTPQLRKHRILHSTTKKIIESTITTAAEYTAGVILPIRLRIQEEMKIRIQEEMK
ncbi:MAG: hypothetical protein LBI18_03890, partial [Planctomycetaceae bacterium]|nr:hypothetical protein [Planctomycetaceae bacterium]